MAYLITDTGYWGPPNLRPVGFEGDLEANGPAGELIIEQLEPVRETVMGLQRHANFFVSFHLFLYNYCPIYCWPMGKKGKVRERKSSYRLGTVFNKKNRYISPVIRPKLRFTSKFSKSTEMRSNSSNSAATAASGVRCIYPKN